MMKPPPDLSRDKQMKNVSFIVDKTLRIRSWSDDLQTLTGADASQAVGKKYTELFPRFLIRDKEAVSETFKRRRTVNLKQRDFQCLLHHQKADIRLAPIRNGNDSVRSVMIDLRPSLPCAIGQQLMDTQKLVAIGKVAATLAHGVRNPLNAIKGAVVYLRHRYAHETTLCEFADILSAEIGRLETFISRFLSTTAFEGDLSLVDVNELIRKIRVFISLQTSTQDIRCDCVLGDIPLIEISEFHLEQALLNVINNSIESMKSGGSLVIKTALRTSSSTPCIAVEITDTGSGFNHTRSASAPSQRPLGAGRGFGLFIADEIIKFYHGHLRISGENGKGTTVTFLLPVAPKTSGDRHEERLGPARR
jgi:two-component system nitrogen regulation sensor histidine kinase GlnL